MCVTIKMSQSGLSSSDSFTFSSSSDTSDTLPFEGTPETQPKTQSGLKRTSGATIWRSLMNSPLNSSRSSSVEESYDTVKYQRDLIMRKTDSLGASINDLESKVNNNFDYLRELVSVVERSTNERIRVLESNMRCCCLTLLTVIVALMLIMSSITSPDGIRIVSAIVTAVTNSGTAASTTTATTTSSTQNIISIDSYGVPDLFFGDSTL